MPPARNIPPHLQSLLPFLDCQERLLAHAKQAKDTGYPLEAAEIALSQSLSVVERLLWIESQKEVRRHAGKLPREFLRQLSACPEDLFPSSLNPSEILGAAERYGCITEEMAESLMKLREELQPTLRLLCAQEEAQWGKLELIAVELIARSEECLRLLETKIGETANVKD
jgi:hypothetical protein